jgi:hypothetical protein
LPVIGLLGTTSFDSAQWHFSAFYRGPKENGYVESRNVAIDMSTALAEGNLNRLPELATDLVRRQVAVIVSTGGGLAALAQRHRCSALKQVEISQIVFQLSTCHDCRIPVVVTNSKMRKSSKAFLRSDSTTFLCAAVGMHQKIICSV